MNLKKRLQNKIKSEIQKRGFKLNNIFYFNFLESVLYKYIQNHKTINFIQIGANDGKRFDPIHEFIKYNEKNISGYVLEPVSDYFLDLCKTYEKYPNIKPLNFAIHNNLSEAIIYKVAKEHENNVPEFALGIASFNPEHHNKTNISSQFLSEEKVNCISIHNLIERYSIKNVDLLVLDTEGYDYDILINLNFEEISPSIIHFEHGLKSQTMSQNQFTELRNLLYKNDYQLFIDKSDVTAVKTFIFYGKI